VRVRTGIGVTQYKKVQWPGIPEYFLAHPQPSFDITDRFFLNFFSRIDNWAAFLFARSNKTGSQRSKFSGWGSPFLGVPKPSNGLFK
jgi:hypothetical protein